MQWLQLDVKRLKIAESYSVIFFLFQDSMYFGCLYF